MLLSLLGIGKDGRNGSEYCPILDNNEFENKFHILEEEDFQRMVESEKERAKRSGRRFILMTMNVEDIFRKPGCLDRTAELISWLKKNTRSIDIIGWKKEGRSLGVIFIEINSFDQEATMAGLRSKMQNGLLALFGNGDSNGSRIDLKLFPEYTAKNGYNGSKNIRLISELDRVSVEKDSAIRIGAAENGGAADSAKDDFLYGFAKQKLLLFCGDMLIVSLIMAASAWTRFGNFFQGATGAYTGAFLSSLLLYFCVFYVFDLYNIGRAFRFRETFPRTLVAVLMGGGLEAAVFLMVPHWQFSNSAFLAQMVGAVALLSGWRILYAKLFQKKMPKIGALVLGSGKKGKFICKLLNSPLSPYQIKGVLDDGTPGENSTDETAAVLGTVDQLDAVSEKVWIKAAILATSRNASPELVRNVLNARLQGLDVVEMATVYERLTGRVPVEHIEDQWLLFADGFHSISKEYIQRIKRLGDIVVAGGVLLLSLPLMAFTALLIKLDTPGDVFYRQNRVGKGGKNFRIVKFRSMVQNAEREGAKWAQKDDSRVTLVGYWMRKFRIDELPQLWNVFKGEMTLVGPRPERPEFVQNLEKVIPYYGVRHAVPPGVTGWAQVNYPYGASVQDALNKLEYDLYYIKNMSLLLDFKIALKTIGVIILGDGAR